MSTIDPQIRTSRVFAGTLAVYDRLGELVFPPHPLTGTAPKVYLHRDPGTEEAEYVSVLVSDDPATSEWVATSPAQSDEVFTVEVLIRSMVPGHFSAVTDPARAVVERLEEIADRVQSIGYDVTSGKPKNLGFDNENRTGRATSVSFLVSPTDEGYVGQATVLFRLSARI